jgi:hypothetical protein
VIDLVKVELNMEIKHSNVILLNKLEQVDELLQHNLFEHPKMDHYINLINMEPKIKSITLSNSIKISQINFDYSNEKIFLLIKKR